MAKRICREVGCGSPVLARDWCSAHYGVRYRQGLIQPEPPNPEHHRLTGVDPVNRVATCSICGPIGIRVGGAEGGRRRFECMEKRKADRRKWRAKTRQSPAARRKYQYNLPEPVQTAVLDAQGGVCAACGGPPERLDHDHDCCPGKNSCGDCARGFLCNRCNIGISWFMDDPERLESAAEYLRNPPIVAARLAAEDPAAR